jgi:hypothetical protein
LKNYKVVISAILSAVLLCTGLLLYAETWDQTTPQDSEAFNLGASRIREFKAAYFAQFNIDHFLPSSESTLGDSTGFHKQVHLLAEITQPDTTYAPVIWFDGTHPIYTPMTGNNVYLDTVFADTNFALTDQSNTFSDTNVFTDTTIYNAPVVFNQNVIFNGNVSQDTSLSLNFNSLQGFQDKVQSNTQVYVSASNNPLSGVYGSTISDTCVLSAWDVPNGTDSYGVYTLIPSTWYYIYICYGVSGTCTVLDVSSFQPEVLFSGYSTSFVRVGAVYLDASNHFMKTAQVGKTVQYIVQPSGSSNTLALPTLSTSTAGSWVSQSVASLIPPTSSIIQVAIDSSGVNNYVIAIAPNANYGEWSTTNPPLLETYGGNGFAQGRIVLTSNNIYVYQQSNTKSFVIGWEDNL